MSGLGRYIELGLRLHFRNRMALIYGYLFPTIFLISFWVLYRYDRVPLAAHIGELLTITVMGGACFGLPTTLVSERERGVWRRYRLLPVSTAVLIAGTLTARFVLLALAAALQLALAMAIGFPGPQHWPGLWLAFACVAVAFMGLGLVIAALADNVPAVQALGQCVFLPMLIIGGVAVPLASLPEWAQRLSLFLPGRYAVQAVQAAVTGPGLREAAFSVIALLVIGAAGCVAGARLFRWDAEERFVARPGRWWAVVALVPWIAVGIVADAKDRAVRTTAPSSAATPLSGPRLTLRAEPSPAERALQSPAVSDSAKRAESNPPAVSDSAKKAESNPPAVSDSAKKAESNPHEASPLAPERSTNRPPDVASPPPPATPLPAGLLAKIDAAIAFDRLPSDRGVVTPIAPWIDPSDTVLAEELAAIRSGLADWAPARAADLEQRVRNLLYLPAVVDLLQLPIESYVPLLVFDRIQQDVDPQELAEILYRIAVDWAGGKDDALDDLDVFDLGPLPDDVQQVRNRAAIYGVKLLGRITGRRGPVVR
jgi:ABC-type transport system involved in cytochrome c biogenesis permease component